MVPLALWGPEGRVECKIKFDVADVAYPVVSLGKMTESGFTFSFDDYKCHMHKDNQRVEIFRKGRIFVLKMRCRWLENKAHMAAPINEVADEEMEVGEGTGDARSEPRADEPRDDPPPPRPREVRPSPMRPGAEAAPTQFDTLSMLELVRGMCGIKRKERPQSLGSATTNGW